MKETARRQQAFIQKSSYFPEICMMEGTTQVIARNCTKCYGRRHTRDRCLTQLDSFVDINSSELSKQKNIIRNSQAGIRSLMKSILEQGRDVDSTRSESRTLASQLRHLISETGALKIKKVLKVVSVFG